MDPRKAVSRVANEWVHRRSQKVGARNGLNKNITKLEKEKLEILDVSIIIGLSWVTGLTIIWGPGLWGLTVGDDA